MIGIHHITAMPCSACLDVALSWKPSTVSASAVAHQLSPVRHYSSVPKPFSPRLLFPSVHLSRVGSVHCPKVTPRVMRLNVAMSDEHISPSEEFSDWLKHEGIPEQAVKLEMFDHGLGCAAVRPLQVGEIAIRIPEQYCVTTIDVSSHPVIAGPAAGRGDMIGLTLWFMYEKAQGKASVWYTFIKLFPNATLSPILWPSTLQEQLLKGSPLLDEIKQRADALEGEYRDMKFYFENDPSTFDPEQFSCEAFKNAFSVIMAYCLYLPTAELFALVPYGSFVKRRGKSQAHFDYSIEDEAVVLKVDCTYNVGEQVFASFGQDRPNSDILCSFGVFDNSNANDFIEIEVGLVSEDRLQTLKQQILQQAGFESVQTFPLYMDRFPTQLLTFMRLARLQDPALFTRISFDRDVILDQSNEYEVLMLLMTECRSRLANYDGGIDDGILNNKELSPEGRLASQLLLSEKMILRNTMAALQKRLASIRGVPTKGGMKDPNSDIKDMFDIVEQVASAPGNFLSNIFQK